MSHLTMTWIVSSGQRSIHTLHQIVIWPNIANLQGVNW